MGRGEKGRKEGRIVEETGNKEMKEVKKRAQANKKGGGEGMPGY